MPVRACRSRAMRSTISSVTFWMLAAMSQWNCSISDSDSRRGLPEELREAVVRHGQAVVVGEVLHVQPERAVLAQVDEVLEDLVEVLRLAVGRRAHHLVLGAVDLEAEVVGEGAVEQAERVREADLAQEFDLVAASHALGRGRPFADAVESQDRGFLEGRGQEGRRRVRLVMLREEQSLPSSRVRARAPSAPRASPSARRGSPSRTTAASAGRSRGRW